MKEILVGLQVTDDETYTEYRKQMLPLLESVGGSFRYDFRIGEVLKSEVEEPINRLFIICFPDEATQETFFSLPEYLKVRDKFFDPSVKAKTILAEYHR